ncbi:MAG TPA: prepilin-type N-terminal cleavage/methylation domain-containing protein [Candidatus Saccharimonadales bacterium]|jgi:prepilin-type N-terminal cleavage/methylation domain-containing protein|nr:prepilin-type N-terminal cleavage/methylation domain-containing protein [Candidatus Saccharimonadales bacterium]
MIKINKKGFTIIELLIATSVFSGILLIVTYGIIQISKMYLNGFIQTQTQNIAVSLSDELSRDIEFSSETSITPDTTTPSGNYHYFCTNQYEYYYIPLGNSLNRVLLSKLSLGCEAPQDFLSLPSFGSNIDNLLSSSNITILNNSKYDEASSQAIMSGGAGGLYTVNIDVLYGNTTNLIKNSSTTDPQYICQPTVLIGPFCSTYDFITNVYSNSES